MDKMPKNEMKTKNELLTFDFASRQQAKHYSVGSSMENYLFFFHFAMKFNVKIKQLHKLFDFGSPP